MILKAKIYMCLALWNPDVSLHSYSADYLSYWYNQQINILEDIITEEIDKPLRKPFLPWDEVRRHFSLPNSEYRFVAECIQQSSEGV